MLSLSYPWSDADVVELSYFSSTEQRFLTLTCDEHLGLLFSLNASSRFGKLHIDVLQPRAELVKGMGVGQSSVSAKSQHPALLVGRDQIKRVVRGATTCLLPILPPIVLLLLLYQSL